MKVNHIAIAVSVLSVLCLMSCSGINLQTGELKDALEDAWDAAEDPIDKAASGMIEDLAERPSLLGKKYQAEWNPTLDQFTITNPIDRSARAAMSLFLGDWGDGFNELDSYARDNMDKQAVVRGINKGFNAQWAALFFSLIALDGSLDYKIETDDWSSNSFDFDADDLYKILKEQGYFNADGNGSYGRSASANRTGGASAAADPFTTQGHHSLTGNFVYNSTKYPVELNYDIDASGRLTDCVYKNVQYGTVLNLRCTGGLVAGSRSDGCLMRLEGKDGKNNMVITLNSDGRRLTGSASSGATTLDVELE